jgi:hypothetical protein
VSEGTDLWSELNRAIKVRLALPCWARIQREASGAVNSPGQAERRRTRRANGGRVSEAQASKSETATGTRRGQAALTLPGLSILICFASQLYC